jgi:hypothetical protein
LIFKIFCSAFYIVQNLANSIRNSDLLKFPGSFSGCRDVTVTNVGWAVAWDLREMGSAWGKGAREGLAPKEARKISSQCSARAETTWTRTRKEGQVGRDEERSAQTE